MLFDGTGEYWGQSLIPYCYPEEIQQRLRYALENNPGIHAVSMRVNWRYDTLFDNLTEINFYALAQLARDPYMPIEEIWQGWAEKRFGKKAARKVISALQRTDDIGNLVYYIRGTRAANHSAIADLPYLESRMVCYAKALVRWNPQDFRTKYWMEELVDHPREHTIEWVIDDRKEALRLVNLSIKDIEEVKPDLPRAEYEKLIYQLTLQKHFIETSIPHIEAFLRYWIEKRNPSKASLDNQKKFEKCLQQLENKAIEIEKVYQEEVPILSAELIRNFKKEVQQAMASL